MMFNFYGTVMLEKACMIREWIKELYPQATVNKDAQGPENLKDHDGKCEMEPLF